MSGSRRRSTPVPAVSTDGGGRSDDDADGLAGGPHSVAAGVAGSGVRDVGPADALGHEVTPSAIVLIMAEPLHGWPFSSTVRSAATRATDHLVPVGQPLAVGHDAANATAASSCGARTNPLDQPRSVSGLVIVYSYSASSGWTGQSPLSPSDPSIQSPRSSQWALNQDRASLFAFDTATRRSAAVPRSGALSSWSTR